MRMKTGFHNGQLIRGSKDWLMSLPRAFLKGIVPQKTTKTGLKEQARRLRQLEKGMLKR